MLSFFLSFASSQGDCNSDKAQKFFGIIPKWYEYLPYKPDSLGKCAIDINNLNAAGLTKLLPIGLAILDMLLRVAGLVAVGYIIYGGIRYITSQGEPENTRSALNTVINALVGLTIAIIASATVSFIASKLGPQ